MSLKIKSVNSKESQEEPKEIGNADIFMAHIFTEVLVTAKFEDVEVSSSFFCCRAWRTLQRNIVTL